jgi:hypothetical protein
MTYSGPMKGGTVAEGELFFGIFTHNDDGVLAVLQDTRRRALMMELIAWDYTRQVFNFWVLIGDGKEGAWRFVGDSNDVLADVAELNLGKKEARFGKRLRCSACHTLGGPVMKELAPPHTDWVTPASPVFLGPLKLQAGNDPGNPRHVAAALMKHPVDAANLSRLVKSGIDRLATVRVKQKPAHQSLGQQLRSLFTPMEINVLTDAVPFSRRVKQKQPIEIPWGFFVDPRLAGLAGQVRVDLQLYQKVLQKVEARFAPDETPGLTEAHHAFNSPGRSYFDNKALDVLVQQGLLDEPLIAAVLMVDFPNPLYSNARAGLLKYVPSQARNAQDLRRQLIEALRPAAANDTAAAALLANLTDPERTLVQHRKVVQAYLDQASRAATDVEAVHDWWRLLVQRRAEVEAAQTAQHPEGRITEPGFRVLFPQHNLKGEPGRLSLDASTARLRK